MPAVFIIILLVFAVMTGAVYIPVQNFFRKNSYQFKMAIIEYLEKITHRQISLDYIEPGFLNYISISNLGFSSPDGDEESLQFSKVKIYYNLFAMLKGDIIEGIREIRIENSYLELDSKRDEDIIRLFREDLFGKGDAENPPDLQGLEISARNLNVSYTGDFGTVNIDNIFLKAVLGSEQYELTLDADASGNLAEDYLGGAEFDSRVKIRGSVDPYLEWATIRASVPELNSSVISFYDQSFQVLLQNDNLRITKILDSNPIDLRCEINLLDGSSEYFLEAQEYVPGSSFILGEDYSNFQPWLSTAVSGNAYLQMNNSDEMNYEVDLVFNAENEYLSDPVELKVDFDGDQRFLNINTLALDTGKGDVFYRGNVLLDNVFPLPHGRLSFNNFTYFNDYGISGTVNFNRYTEKNLKISYDRFRVNTVIFTDGLTEIAMLKNGISFSWRNYFNNRPESLFAASGEYIMGGAQGSELHINSENIPGSVIGIAFPPFGRNEILSDGYINFAVTLNTDLSRFSYRLKTLEYYQPDIDLAVIVSAEGDEKSTEIDRITMKYGESDASGSALINYNSGGIDFSAVLDVIENSYFLEGDYTAASGLNVNGNYGFDLRYKPGQNRSNISLSTNRLPVRIGKNNTFISADIDGWINSRGDFSVRSKDTVISDLPVPLVDNSISLTGTVNNNKAEFSRITFRDIASSVSGSAVMNVNIPDMRLDNIRLTLNNAESQESYDADMSLNIRRNTISSNIDFKKIPFSRFPFLPLVGTSSGNLNINGKLNNPEIVLSLDEFDAKFDFDVISGNLEGTADVMDMLNSPNITISLDRIESDIDSESIKGSLLASAMVKNPQSDPDIELDVKDFSGVFDPGFMEGRLSGNAEFDANFKQSQVQQLVEVFQDGIKLHALRKFVSDAIDQNDPVSAKLRAALSLSEGKFTEEGTEGSIHADAGIYTDVARTDAGFQISIDNAKAEFEDLVFRLTGSLSAGAVITGEEIVHLVSLIEDGIEFRDILRAYTVSQFSDFRNGLIAELNAEEAEAVYRKDNLTLSVNGAMNAYLAKGLLSMAAEGADIRLYSESDNSAYDLSGKVDLSGRYDSEDLYELAVFMENVESLRQLEEALYAEELPDAFWNTYLVLLADRGIINLKGEGYDLTASLDAKASGNLKRLDFEISPGINGEIRTPDNSFRGNVSGTASLKAGADNKFISTLLSVISEGKKLEDINSLLSWTSDPDIVVNLVLNGGVIENENNFLPVNMSAEITSNLNFVNSKITGNITDGYVQYENFFGVMNAFIQSKTQGQFVNFNAVLYYLDSEKTPEDLHILIDSLFQSVESTTIVEMNLDAAQYSDDNMVLPVQAAATVETDINTDQIGEIIRLFNDVPDLTVMLKKIAEVSEDVSVDEAARVLAISIVNNEFSLRKLEAAFDDYPDLAEILSSRLDAEVRVTDGRIILPWLDANVDIYAAFSGELNDPKSDIMIAFRDSEVELNDFSGIVNATARFEGSLANPRLSVDFGNTYGKLKGYDVSVFGEASSQDNVIYLDDLDIQFDFLKLDQLKGDYKLDTGRMACTGRLNGGFAGYPLAGDISIDMSAAGGLKMTEIADIIENDLSVNVVMSDISLGEQKRDSLAFTFEKTGDSIDIFSDDEYSFAFHYGGSEDIILDYSRNDTRVQFDAKNNEDLFEISLSVVNFDLDFVKVLRYESFGSPFAFLSDYTLNTSGLFYSGLDRYSFAVPKFEMYADEDRKISFSLSGNNDEITLNNFRFYNIADKLDASSSIRFTEDEEIIFRTDLTFNGADYRFNAQGPLDNLVLFGSHGLYGKAGISGEHSFYKINLDQLPLVFNQDYPTLISISSSGDYYSANNWNIGESTVKLVNLPFLSLDNSIEISGSADSDKGADIDLKYSDAFSALEGSGGFLNLTTDNNKPVWEFFGSISSADEEELYTVDGIIRNGITEGDIIIRSFPVNRIPGQKIGGFLSADIRLNALEEESSIDYSILLRNASELGYPLTVSASGVYKNTVVSIDQGQINFLGTDFADISGKLETFDGSFAINSNYISELNDNRVNAEIDINGRFISPFANPPVMELLYSDINGTLALNDLRVGNSFNEDWSFDFYKTGREFLFNGGPSEGVYGELKEGGEFRLSFSEQLPITFNAEGNIKENELDAIISGIDIFLPSLRYILRIPFINFTDGWARGDMTISGSVNDPDFNGDLFGSSIIMKTDFVPEELGPVDTTISFKGKKMEIPVLFTGNDFNNLDFLGEFEFERWLPSYYKLTFKTFENDRAGVHINLGVSVLDVNGRVTGSFLIEGDGQGAEITGGFTVFNCAITQREKTESKVSSMFDTIVDLDIKTGRNVSFIWPRAVPILYAYAKTGQDFSVYYNSGADELSLKGNIAVQSGTIYYSLRNFYIRSGKLIFNETEDIFEPKVTARAELNDISSEGERVKLFLVLENDPLSNLTPDWDSQPFLSSAEIASILSPVYTSESDSSSSALGLGDIAKVTTDFISQMTIMRDFEQKVEDILNLDLFSIRTQMIQNVLIERIFEEGDESTDSGSIAKYLDNTTLFFGKHFGNDVYLEALVRIEANEYNAAAGLADDSFSVDTELALEWETPLFTFDFSFEPDLTDLEKTVDSINLGLSWGFQY